MKSLTGITTRLGCPMWRLVQLDMLLDIHTGLATVWPVLQSGGASGTGEKLKPVQRHQTGILHPHRSSQNINKIRVICISYMLSQQCVPVWLSGRALCQQRKRLWVRFPGITHTNVHPHLSWFTVASIIRTFRLENRYVFNSPLQTVSTVFTVRYHITLLYHMYCIASWLVLLLKQKL